MFKFIVDNLMYPIIILKEDTIYYINEAAERLYPERKNLHEILQCIPKNEVIMDEELYSIKLIQYKEYKIYIYINQTQENNLKMKLHVYEEILNKIQQGIYVQDVNDNVVFMNKKALEIDNYDTSVLQESKGCDLYYHGDSSFCAISFVLKNRKALEKKVNDYYLSNGTLKNVITDSYPWFYQDKFVGLYQIYNDLEVLEQNLKYTTNLYNTLKDESIPNKLITFNSIIGESENIKRTKNLALKVADSPSDIMLYGETGTGKELFAQNIHNESHLSQGPFIPINCAAVPDTLMEAIFFGSVKGAYTGALDRPGLFEQANNGTLFLDEINSMNINLQSKLLRAIEEKKVSRLGSDKIIDINCRIISGLNQNPDNCVIKNTLREDLYYRLSSFILEIPPLRRRKGDVPLLIKHFIGVYNKKFNYSIVDISKDLLKLLCSYDFPGNVRELKHFIELAFNLANHKTKTITKEHLTSYILNKLENNKTGEQKELDLKDINDLNSISNNLERNVIVLTLKENSNNITETAKKLGMSRQSLQYRIKKYNINSS